MPLLPPELAPATGKQAPTYQRGPAPSFFLLVLLRGRILFGPRRGKPQLLAPPVLLAPPLAALAMPPRALPLACRPLLLPLLRRPTERVGVRGGRDGLRGAEAQQL
jgi:hypothetical protein